MAFTPETVLSCLSSGTEVIGVLKKLREAAGLTQNALAEASGVSLRMIQLYEQGQRDIMKAEAGTVLKLAKVLNVTMEKIIEE